MLPYVMVRFSLSGDKIPLHDIAQKIGIPPARIRKKEDWPRPSILAGVAKDMLEFRTDKEECRAVSTQLGKIQAMLTPKIETIREVMQKYSRTLSNVHRTYQAVQQYTHSTMQTQVSQPELKSKHDANFSHASKPE